MESKATKVTIEISEQFGEVTFVAIVDKEEGVVETITWENPMGKLDFYDNVYIKEWLMENEEEVMGKLIDKSYE